MRQQDKKSFDDDRSFIKYISGEEVSPPDVEDNFPYFEAYARRLKDEITNSLDSPKEDVQEIPSGAFEDPNSLANLINRLEIIAGFHNIDYASIEEEVEELRHHVTLDRAKATLTAWEDEAMVKIDYNGASVELKGVDIKEFNHAISELKEVNGVSDSREVEAYNKTLRFADDLDGMDWSLTTYTLQPDTQKFKVGSCLARQDSPVTAQELETVLEGTSWEKDQKSLGRTLSRLYDEGYAGRRRRERESRGQNPYEYLITRFGDALIRQSEQKAQKLGEPTWDVLRNTEQSLN